MIYPGATGNETYYRLPTNPAPVSTLAPTTPPASPISGNPTQVSILQPNTTTAIIAAQAQSGVGYQSPTPSFDLISASSVPQVGTSSDAGTQASGVSFTSPQFSLNLDSNTILILLVLAAIVLVLL